MGCPQFTPHQTMYSHQQMLFTWDTNNLCIIFRSWRVTGNLSLVLSFIAVMALTAGYEAVREASRRYEQRHAEIMENTPRKYRLLRLLVILAAGEGLCVLSAKTTTNDAHSCGQEVRRKRKRRRERWSRLLSTGCKSSTRSSSCECRLRLCLNSTANTSRLLFMTYNGWIMLAVGLGAFFGYLIFGGGSIVKSAACH